MPAQGDDRRTEELEEIKLSEEMVDKQLDNISTELKSAVEWQENTTGDEIRMGYQNDLSFD